MSQHEGGVLFLSVCSAEINFGEDVRPHSTRTLGFSRRTEGVKVRRTEIVVRGLSKVRGRPFPRSTEIPTDSLRRAQSDVGRLVLRWTM